MLKAIDTEYKGFLFRSRLEARWAVFFEHLGIPWEYEKEGYDLNGLYYLPDFWLPEQQCWFEVKGARPTVEEQEKAARLAQYSGHDVILAFGPIGEYVEDGFWIYRGGDAGYDNCYSWCVPNPKEGPPCRTKVTPLPQYDLRYCESNYRLAEFDWILEIAYTAARQARFEHGAS